MKNYGPGTALTKLVISCGGTGGHFYPGLSIARTFQAAGGEVQLLLSGVNSASQAATAAKFGIRSDILPRMPSAKHPFRFAKGLILGYWQSRRILKAFRPQAALGMGSFASLPPLAAAWTGGISIFLHDGNARIGLANRVLSRIAKCLGNGYPPVNGDGCFCPMVPCGMPVRPELLEEKGLSRAEGLAQLREHFSVPLEEERTTFLIFGGSQGAAIFNEVLPLALRELAADPGTGKFQVLHLCGKGKMQTPQEIYAGADFPVLLLESNENMHWFLAAADLVLARSGGSSLAELALFGKPAVLIPYPYAAENHQFDNAETYVKGGAGVLVLNKDFDRERALKEIRAFLRDPELRVRQREAALKLARPAAAEEFLNAISAALTQEPAAACDH